LADTKLVLGGTDILEMPWGITSDEQETYVLILVFCNQAFTGVAYYFTTASPTIKTFLVSFSGYLHKAYSFLRNGS
jgi:hypothetical protein